MPDPTSADPLVTAQVSARRRLSDAMHAMHYDQRIIVDSTLAHELNAAWDAYDASLTASFRAELDALRGRNEVLQRQVDGRVTVAEELQRRHDAVESLAARISALRARLVQTEAVVEAAKVVDDSWKGSNITQRFESLARLHHALAAADD